jgi:hypothetical protein
MFKFIQHWINNLMVVVSASTYKEVMVGQYNLLMDELDQARTLSELVRIKKHILAFDTSIKTMGSPAWASNYTRYLDARWNRRYRLWKLRD